MHVLLALLANSNITAGLGGSSDDESMALVVDMIVEGVWKVEGIVEGIVEEVIVEVSRQFRRNLTGFRLNERRDGIRRKAMIASVA